MRARENMDLAADFAQAGGARNVFRDESPRYRVRWVWYR